MDISLQIKELQAQVASLQEQINMILQSLNPSAGLPSHSHEYLQPANLSEHASVKSRTTGTF